MISLKNVSKWYGHFQVLTDCTTEVKKGEVVVVCGPSGSGKSTLIKTVNGLEPIQQGNILVNGTPVNDKKTNLAQLRSKVGMVFQHFELFPHLSIIDNLTLAQVKVLKRDKDASREKGLKLLERVGLTAHANKFPGQLSGGQQQRVALARALITDPEALLLDEPLSALDPFLKIRMRAELKKLQTSLGITFVHVTHSQEEAMALADIIVIMNDGRIEQAAHPRTVFERPATAFVAKFMGDHNVISGRVTKSEGDELMISVPAGGDFLAIGAGAAGLTDTADIAVRTDHVRVAPATEKGLGFTGSVSNVEYRGSSVKLTVNGAGVEDFTAILSDKDYFANPVKVGDAIPLSWGREDALVLGRLKH